MTTDTGKIEELACPFCWSKNTNEFSANRVIDEKWHERLVTRCLDCLSEASTEVFRSLSAELAELRQVNVNLRAQRDAATERWVATEGEVIELRQAKIDLVKEIDRLEDKLRKKYLFEDG